MGYRLFIIFSLALFPLQVLNAQQSLSLLKTYELERPLVLMEIRNHSAEVLLQAGKEMKENRDEMNPQDVRSMEVIIAAALLQQSGYDSIRTLLKWVDQSDEQASQYPQQALGEIILSLVNIFQNKYSETYEYAKSAGRQFLKQGDTANYAMSRSMEGLALYNLGIREEGLNTYRESINLYQITGFASEAELGKANLSAFYINSKNFQKGVELLDELLNTPQITLKPHFQVVAWGNYSLALLKLNRTDLALRYAVKTELMADTISFPVGKCYGKILQAKISQQIGDWSVAQQILDDLQELSNVMEGNPSLKSFYLHALGRQQDYRKEYAAAIQSFKSSAALAKPDLVFPSLDDAYAGWHGAASKMGDAEQASMVFQKMSAMKDSLYVASTNASLDLYAAREQLTQKDIELNAVQKELAIKSLQRERLIVVLGIICLLFALVVLYIRLSDIRATNERVEAHNQTLSSYARELEELAFVVSHNLRETSRNINSYSGLLAKKAGASLDEKSRGYLSNVQQAAVRSYEMLVDLETYVGIGKSLPVSQCVDMNLLVEQEGKEFMNTYQLPEQTIAQEKLPRMQAHPALIQILFRCLYENAAKYRSQKPLRIHISYQIAAASHVIRFSDNGIGLNEAYAEKIFRVFQRLHTQDEIPGTGIGLALAAKIMRVYGGTISVQSQEGNGASFSMSFPFSVVGNKELKYPSKPIFRPL